MDLVYTAMTLERRVLCVQRFSGELIPFFLFTIIPSNITMSSSFGVFYFRIPV